MQKYRSLRPRKDYFQLTDRIDSPLDLYEHLPFQIAVVSNLLQLSRDVTIKDIINLEPREIRVILNIGSYMPIKSADIAYQSRLDAYTITRAVKKLQQLNMIELEHNQSNKKEKHWILSEQGIEVYKKICQEIENRNEIIEMSLSAQEKSLLMNLLAKMEDRVEMMLADNAQLKLLKENKLPADQKEIIRWNKKSSGQLVASSSK